MKFNLMILLNSSKLAIELVGDSDYSQFFMDFSTISDLSGSYYDSDYDDMSNYLYLPSLNKDNARNIIQLISHDFLI